MAQPSTIIIYYQKEKLAFASESEELLLNLNYTVLNLYY